MMRGQFTSEHKQSKLVIACSIILPVVGHICDLLLEHSILDGNGSLAIMVGLLSSAIASCGYSYSRGQVKSAEAQAEAIKKKSLVVLSKKQRVGSGEPKERVEG